ncbi:hypothetical protein C0992_011267 [Termitomyces sp. T32_za158]|nr:hypothetical protein C0992_011267 [Termitomyces sp. T32_za158]
MGSQATLALQVSLVLKNLHTIDAQEYLFVVDRSDSMANASPESRIDIAKNTLLLLLRMLPVSGTMFNVYFFNDHIESLSPRGLKYNKENFRKANKYVDGILPEGGTGLPKAIRHALQARDLRIPTTIFLLTDGEASNFSISYLYTILRAFLQVDRDDAIKAVRDAVAQAPISAPLRVFTLGIGDGISTATCEGIATAGNGVCLYATQTETIIGK